jgi:hypothetical protein
VLASTRPPKDSVVRYCLTCSAKTGRLVERIAPALERKRAAATVTAATKAKAKRARVATARQKAKEAETDLYTVEGVDLRDEFKRLLKLRAFGGSKGRLVRNPPTFDVRRRSQVPTSRLGIMMHGSHRIILQKYPGLTLADACETLVHELTHAFLPSHVDHGPLFKTTMTAAFKEAYKVLPLGVGHNVYHGRYAAALRRKEAQA